MAARFPGFLARASLRFGRERSARPRGRGRLGGTREKWAPGALRRAESQGAGGFETPGRLCGRTDTGPRPAPRLGLPRAGAAAADEPDATATEVYAGEWRGDWRAGLGVARRSDGLRYEGEWAGDRRHGYGATTFPDGSREEGKYKRDALAGGRRRNLIPLRAGKAREKVERAVEAAAKAADIAQQKAEIAASRTAHARAKAEAADAVALKAEEECRLARLAAKEFSPSFQHRGNGLEYQRLARGYSMETYAEPLLGGAPGSPELYMKGTTPPDLTPELSPAPTPPEEPRTHRPPAHRVRGARFHRQGAVDDGTGGAGDVQLSAYELETRPLLPTDSAPPPPPPRQSGHARPSPRKPRAGPGGGEGLRLGEGIGEGPRPLCRDVTLSPPTRSTPIIPESEEEGAIKQNTGSSPLLVAMVILLNIGVAVLFIHLFI
ncbi:hypothetical protein MATL_G00093060 [Megalops atlanticus]|uniref:Junctophilin n=1 Tax=Megalops atlanticus TaxID=7932 RepID=A0A9D3Q3P9_MEGAT|nr:hypothetical protein MATL_G00093060 [Megalops atlanticus]